MERRVQNGRGNSTPSMGVGILRPAKNAGLGMTFWFGTKKVFCHFCDDDVMLRTENCEREKTGNVFSQPQRTLWAAEFWPQSASLRVKCIITP